MYGIGVGIEGCRVADEFNPFVHTGDAAVLLKHWNQYLQSLTTSRSKAPWSAVRFDPRCDSNRMFMSALEKRREYVNDP